MVTLAHMQTDRYTRFLLTIIAMALVAQAARGLQPIRSAWAAETLRCEIANEVKVTGKLEIDTFNRPLRVDIDDVVKVKHDDILKTKSDH